MVVVFFFKQKTAYEMRISDWSSDVCSSDLAGHDRGGRVAHRLTLDWADRVTALAVLDLVPTYAMYMDTDRRIAKTYWQWYFLPQPALKDRKSTRLNSSH